MLVAESNMEELTISLENSYIKKLKANNVLALVAISGKGEIIIEDETYSIEEKYYTNIIAENDISINFRNTGNDNLRLAIVEVPQKVNYPLYGEN